ncbi:unnamed protein product, partial [Gongylonema pulchrum]|uniref:Protein kinase domain-containing protein n=1 Tax=Gongylonema pulchrum TaxID=637853 RepID=A0A183CYN2_9BILA
MRNEPEFRHRERQDGTSDENTRTATSERSHDVPQNVTPPCNRNLYSRGSDEGRHVHQHYIRIQILKSCKFQRQLEDAPQSSKQVLARHGYALTSRAKLGYGHYSKVCEGVHRKCGEKIAIKIIDTRKVTQEYKLKFMPREIDIWKRMCHPNLVALLDVFQEAGKVFLAMELAEKGDLVSHFQYSEKQRHPTPVLTLVQEKGAQPEATVQTWMKQLVSAVYYLHMRSIAHRDLKLENILLFNDNSVKIADFGFCREVHDGDMSLTFCGSKSYSAPEILLGQPYPPFKAD